MPALDVFQNSAFDMISLTGAINKLPYKPKLLQTLGLFSEVPVRSHKVFIEERRGKLALIPEAARGTINRVRTQENRVVTNFRVPHVPLFQTILADDVQNIRAFGSETELEAIASLVNDSLQGMRDNHEVTHEYHRVGALKGVILDADGSTPIVNLFSAFGLTQVEQDFDWSIDDFGPVCTAIIRRIATELGGSPFGQIFAICGDDYFDAVVTHESTKLAYNRWRESEFLRVSQLGPEWYSVAANGFMFQNIMFVNYRGQIGDVAFIPADEAYFIPSGVPDLFQEIIAPGDFVETVNTRGQRFYAKQQPLDFNKGIELHTQSNVLAMNTRPTTSIKSTVSNYTGVGSGSG